MKCSTGSRAAVARRAGSHPTGAGRPKFGRVLLAGTALGPAFVAAFIGVFLGAMALLPAGQASAHAGLVSSEPAASSVLETGPDNIVLTFDEAVEAGLSSISLFDAQAQSITLGTPVAAPGNDSVVAASVPSLSDGIYAVVWRVTSVDGHVVDGAFSFQVGTAATDGSGGALLDQVGGGGSASSIIDRLLIISRMLGYLGAVVLLGAGLFAIGAPGRLAEASATKVLLRIGAALLVGGTLLQFGMQGATVVAGGFGDALSPNVWGRVADTQTGRMLLLRAAMSLVLVVMLALYRHRSTAWWRSTAITAAVITIVSFPASGHAASLDPQAWWTAVDSLHMVAIVVWLGGLVLLIAGGRAWLNDDEAVPTVRRFSAASTVCVPVIVATGVAQTWKLAHGFSNLTDTDWGRMLLIKVAVVTALVTVGGVSRWLLQHSGVPSIRRTVATEAVLGIAVLALAAGLVGQAPRPQVDSTVFTASITEAGVIAEVTLTPGHVGANEIHVVITPAGGSVVPVVGASGRILLPSRDLPPAPITFVAEGANHYSGVITLPFAGEWTLELVVEPTAGSTVLISTTVPIP